MFESGTSHKYLGFNIDTKELEIQLTLTTHDRLNHLLRFVSEGSEKDQRRVADYAQWILYNLRFPLFLARDILDGDPTYMLAAEDIERGYGKGKPVY